MVRSPGYEPLPYVSRLLSGKRKTPFLVMSKPLISERIAEFCSCSRRVDIFYALKANPDTRLISFMDEQGVGFEISAEKELAALLGRGIPGDRIISSNPVKAPLFIQEAYRAGIRSFVADSLDEVDKIHRYAPGSELLVRLAVDNAGSEWPLGGKFGAEPEMAIRLLQHGAKLGLKVEGVTFHVGSQCTAEDSWGKALRKARDLWHCLGDQGIDLCTLNLGGGFPVKYTRQVPLVPQLMELVLAQTSALFPKDIRIQMEPGRALVGDAGTLVSRVIGKSQRGDENWLYLDVGVFNGLMESLGGILYEFHTSGGGPARPWVLAGPSCDALDVIARDVLMPEPAIGDYVFVLSAGAYTTCYSSEFNGSRIPRVYLVEER